ncbi:MAG: hypothetical protein MSC30_07940 [Gaiellaceae bacterium MAG52_C11]|nr:hypothetical protein [Candidatus Gaiellasilicea maunaloa]
MTWKTASIEAITDAAGMAQIRRYFDIGAFGVNAWTAGEAGAVLVQEHTESDGLDQEELYVVLSGTATFVLGDEKLEASPGTLVFVPPEVRRSATGTAGTTVLAVGATRDVVYQPTGWEIGAPALPLFTAGDYAGAKALLTAGLNEFPESPLMLYNLACAEARLGERHDAVAHLVRAAALDARFAEYAQSDDDLATIRDDPSFPGGAG